MEDVPSISFLGICDRSRQIWDQTGFTVVSRDILGLKNSISSGIYPLSLNGVFFVFGLYNDGVSDECFESKITMIDDCFNVLFTLNIVHSMEMSNDSTRFTSTKPPEVGPKGSGLPVIPAMRAIAGWNVAVFSAENSPVIKKPGIYGFALNQGNKNMPIGFLDCQYKKPDPISQETIYAIKSNPNSMKHIRVEFGCQKCNNGFKCYTGIEKNDDIENQGYIWYQEIDDKFICQCGEYEQDLSMIRDGFHLYLEEKYRELPTSENMSLARMYEKNELQHICDNFAKILDNATIEEEVQEFIKNNPIIFQFLSPVKIIPKASIINKYKTDFAILTPKGELILVEIENPNIKLMVQDGDPAQELNHAFSQVRNWFSVIERFRDAVITGMDLKPEKINKITGVVIAGRDKHYSSENLSKLKGIEWGGIEFYTFDDVLGNFVNMIRRFVSV